MATRFYLIETAATVAPAFSATWSANSGARRILLLSPLGSNDSFSAAELGIAESNVAIRQYISSPLLSQTISGSIKGQILAQEGNSLDDCCAQLRLRVVKSDLTDRGVLLDVDGSGLTHEFATTLTNRQFPRGGSVALSSLAVQAGDRLVLEIGFKQSSTTTNLVNIQVTGNAGADLPENETATSPDNSWIELSQTLLFGDDPPLGFSKQRIATQAAIIASWYKWRAKGASGGGTAQAAPSNPPFSGRDSLNDALRAWQPGEYYPHFRRPRTPQQAVGPQDPPFNSRTRAQQVAIATAWYKWRPAGTSGAGIPVSPDNPPFQRPSVQVANLWWAQPDEIIEIITPGLILWPDDPPFDQVQAKSIHASIVGSWHQPWVGQQRIRRVVQGITVQVDNPPANDRQQPNLLHWEPPLPPVQARTLIPQPSTESVDNPPFKGRDNIDSILRSWQPGDPGIIVKPPLTPPSIDNPPRLVRIFDQTAWQLPFPAQQPRARVIQPGVTAPSDNPPFGSRNSLYAILGAWYKSLEQPIILPKFLNPTELGSPPQIDFPPVRAMRQPDYGFWWADPQPTQMRITVPQPFIPPPPNPCFVEELPITGTWTGEVPMTGAWTKEAGTTNTWTSETPKVC